MSEVTEMNYDLADAIIETVFAMADVAEAMMKELPESDRVVLMKETQQLKIKLEELQAKAKIQYSKTAK